MLKILQNHDATRRCSLVHTWKTCLDAPAVIGLGISWQPDPEPKTSLGVSHPRHAWSETMSLIHVSLFGCSMWSFALYQNQLFYLLFFFLSIKGHFNECNCDNLQRLEMWYKCNTHRRKSFEFWPRTWFILTSTIIIKLHCVFKWIQLVQVALRSCVSVSHRCVLRSTTLASLGSSHVLKSSTKCQVFHCRAHGNLTDRWTLKVLYCRIEKIRILI